MSPTTNTAKEKIRAVVQSASAGDSLPASLNADEQLLAGLGYKQEFKREFNALTTACFCFSIMGVVASVSATLNFPLDNAGHVGIVWGWITAAVFVMTVALSMAELCSAMPTSGGLYYWSARLAPKGYAPIASWITGWSNITGQVSLVCSIAFTNSEMIACAIQVGSGTVLSTGAIYGIFIVLLASQLFLCSAATGFLARINVFYVLINVGTTLAVIIAFAVLGDKQPASVAFGKFENNSGWSNNGMAFLLSLTSAMWSLTGYDSAAHIAEETTNAAKVGPVAIVSAVSGTAILGWALNIATSFVIPSVPDLLSSDLPLPMAQVFLNVLGKHGMLAIWSLVIIVQYVTSCAQLVDASRVVFAFARDNALPGSRWWKHVNGWTRTPVNAVAFVASGSALLGLLTFQTSGTAINALSSCSVIALYISYAIPIFLRITSGRSRFKAGSWSLGKFAIPCGAIASAWVIFIIFLLLCPPDSQPTKETMNWAVLIFGVVLIGSGGWYLIDARKWFKAPITNVPSNGSKMDHDGALAAESSATWGEKAGLVNDEETSRR